MKSRYRSAVRVQHAGDRALRAHRTVTHVDVVPDRFDRVVQRLAVRVAVDHHRLARSAAEQLIDRRIERFPADVPERCVDRTDRRHRHGPAAPVRTLIKVVPRVLDAARVAADQERHDMVGQIARDGELATVERRVAQPVHAVFGDDLQRHEIPARAADDDFRVDDSHGWWEMADGDG